MPLSYKHIHAHLAWVVILLSGCGQVVQGDRSIPFSSDGASVSFQNGRDGVFVADPETGKPRKIFEPTADVIATSTPLWAPTEKKLIFTTARLTSGQAPAQPAEQDPAGSMFGEHGIVYTCWLRDESEGQENATNIKLFDAPCNHSGYIGANLAVRWHPKGDRVFFVAQIGAQHILFEYTLETKKTARAFPHHFEALVFDVDPAGMSLIVAGGSAQPNVTLDGLWLSSIDKQDWWHIPRTHELARADKGSLHVNLIERLRATLPAWSKDGTRFAFCTSTGGEEEQPVRHTLHLGDAVMREAEVAAEGPEPFRELHWQPDGGRLGFIRGEEFGKLQFFRLGDKQVAEVKAANVRRFAGWDHSGKYLAYVAAEMPLPNDSPWTTLLVPDAGSRDGVYLADGAGNDPGKACFSGMRVTFPQWSPKEKKLSLWLTFSPTYRSLPSIFGGAGLRSGDPAATLDVTNGNITWMATNAYEKAQIGHYHLARREYEQAWKWYTEAEGDLPPAKPATAAEATAQILHPRDFSFFEYYCLTKLGRHEEAKAKWEQFNTLFMSPVNNKNGRRANDNGPLDWLRDLRGGKIDLLRDLYAAEVFLSLNAAEDAQAYFEKALKEAPDEAAKVRIALVLSQIHLVRKHDVEYARLATDILLPHLLKTWKPRSDDTLDWGGQDDSGLLTPSVVALAPLATPEFLAILPEKEVRNLVDRCTALRAEAKGNVLNLGMDLILRAAHGRLGQDKEKQEAADRVQKNAARTQLLAPEFEKNPVTMLRSIVTPYEQMMQLLRRL